LKSITANPFRVKFRSPVTLSAIDNCLVVGLPGANTWTPQHSDRVSEGIEYLISRTEALGFSKSVLDLRGVESCLYEDVKLIIDDLPGDTVVAFADERALLRSGLTVERHQVVYIGDLSFPKLVLPSDLHSFLDWLIWHPSDAAPQLDDISFEGFDEQWSSYQHQGLPPRFRRFLDKGCEDFSRLMADGSYTTDALEIAAHESVGELTESMIQRYLRRLAVYSPLIQLCFQENNGLIRVVPYHAAALYKSSLDDGSVIVTRPAILATRFHAVLHRQLELLEALLNDSSIKEQHLQEFFEKNPELLCGAEYDQFYPQVRLHREGKEDLIPDFVLQPVASKPWADILDLKLPLNSIVAGSKNRRHLSSYVQSGIAQLREYSAYFDDSSHRDALQSLGLRCYKPKLTLVIGRGMPHITEPNVRRELTGYPNLQVLSYDQLLEHARNRLLL
jgi:hypothetical protein